MYEENQKRALHRVQAKGSMRDFFKQRREIEQNGNIQHVPTINNHYKMIKQGGQSQNGGTWSPNNGSRQHSGTSVKSMGRDRGNPLAPIDRNATVPQKPQRHGRPSTKDSVVEDKKKQMNGYHKNVPSRTGSYRSEKSPVDETPPPNISNLKNIKNQKMNRSGKPPSGKSQQAKMTEFQKWQMEQNQERENRLNAHRQENSGYEYEPSEDEGDENDNTTNSQDEIARKQRELMEQIARQQADLERIRVEREREEIEEKKEMERRKKREEERRRRMKEEEERRRKEEEERKKEEEEFQRRLAETEANKPKYNARPQHQEEDFYTSSNKIDSTYRRYSPEEQYQPTPPPKPKPARVQKRQQPPKHPAPVERSPSPQFTTNDISMYEKASQDADAYADSKIKLATCNNCGRKFAADRLQRHKNACGNVTKKRKVMDPTKMRVAGTEMENYADSRNRSKTPPKKNGDWRKKRESFIQALRYAKKCAEIEKTGGSIRDITPPPPSENPDYKQCPYCSRKFNPDAAARHIPRCKDLNTRPPPARKGRR